jgi:hypothetical protein
MVAEAAIRTAMVAKITAADGTARVHRRRRYPPQGRQGAYADLFRIDSDPKKKINGYMIRRLRRVAVMKGIPGRLWKVTHTYQITFYSHFVESADAGVASEESAQLAIETLAAAFESDVQIGLGNTVSHTGLQMPLDFTDVVFGDGAQAHRADLTLEVTTTNVNC